MSSPAIAPGIAFSGSVSAPPSDADAGAGGNCRHEGTPEGVSIRPMRVKVLYTFDDLNKTNCLARWPQILNIQTAYLDETTRVGVIELKTCIQAIVSASPELVAKLGQDYTVYAYDYSEYDTPLVGQGMLSWVLASASSTPSAPAHQSRTMITGRVCKNILGLFSNGVQETLEVKLRLVPVPNCLQSEYLSSMEKYRELSKIIPEGFDASAWTAFLQANPNIGRLTEAAGGRPNLGQRIGTDLEVVQQLLNQTRPESPGSRSRSCGEHGLGGSNAFGAADISGQFSRTASPVARSPSAAAAQPIGQDWLSRPSSRASIASQLQLPEKARQDNNLAEDGADNGTFEEPGKKRARLTKADWNGKACFGTNGESLRVVASTAASIRMHRPIAVHPSATNLGALEQPPRAPTPRPQKPKEMQQVGRSHIPGALRRESLNSAAPPYVSPFSPRRPSVEISQAESIMSSPEDSRNDTPTNIASSPPVMRDPSPIPSSPGLPPLPHDIDSGFMSGSIEDLFEDNSNKNFPTVNMNTAGQTQKQIKPLIRKEFSIQEVIPGPPELLPQKILPRTFDTQRKRALKTLASSEAGPPQEELPPSRVYNPIQPKPAPTPNLPSSSLPEPSTMSLRLPLVPSSDPTRPQSSTLQRSQTWSAPQARYADSDAPTPAAASELGDMPKPRSGSGAKRKKAIQDRLATSIAAGEMPPYCENCGAIETPTWRKAWTKVHSGPSDQVALSNEDGAVIACETLRKDDAGNVTLFKITKKSLLEDDTGFTEILLCNPCGLWLNKTNCMRPSHKWDKGKKALGEKRKRAPRKKKNSATTETDSDSVMIKTRVSAKSIDDVTPVDREESSQDRDDEEGDQLPPPKRPRASSLQPDRAVAGKDRLGDTAAVVALQRAIQSSPARLLGTKISPIDLEDTPKPTRRLLFPSPRKEGEMKTLQDRSAKLDTQAPPPRPLFHHTTTDQSDKENRPPEVVTPGDDFNELFVEEEAPLRPSTPPATATSSSAETLLKTPIRVTPGKKPCTPRELLSSAARNLLNLPSTPTWSPSKLAQLGTDMTPFSVQLNRFFNEGGTVDLDFPDLPSLDNTPRAGADGSNAFNLDDFDPQDLISTDVPVPSSPPPPFFALYEDPLTAAPTSTTLWSDYNFTSDDGLLSDGRTGDGEGLNDISGGGDGAESSTAGRIGSERVPISESKSAAATTTAMATIGVDFSALIDEFPASGGAAPRASTTSSVVTE